MKLYDYQQNIFDEVVSAPTDDLVQLDTGAGKTPIEAALCKHYENVILIAHRNILITQCSEKLAAFSVYHSTLSSEYTRRRCMLSHKRHGRNYIKRAGCSRFVASIDTLYSHHKRGNITLDTSKEWLIIIDEAHHVIADNKWGVLKHIFPYSRVIGFTATPSRMDGEPLAKTKGGMFDRLVQAKGLESDSIKTLITTCVLSGFKFYTPPVGISNNDKSVLNISDSPVNTYKTLMMDKQTIVMCPSIKNAEELADEFKAENISAACISSAMSATDVSRVIDFFANGKIKVLCNVDMVGEGFDVPAVEGLILARKTKSFTMYRQWIGRALRQSEGKSFAIIADLCGNYEHGIPDDNIIWDLESPPKTPDSIKTYPCKKCGFWYPIKQKECPECGYENKLLIRSSVGGHYVNINRLDTGLIEKARREQDAESREEKLSNEIIIPYSGFDGSGVIGRTAEKIRISFVNKLYESGINNFLMTERNINFYINNFKAKDAKSLSAEKANKVFERWQRSN